MKKFQNASEIETIDLIGGVEKVEVVHGTMPYPLGERLVTVGYTVEIIKTIKIGKMSFDYPAEMQNLAEAEILKVADDMLAANRDDILEAATTL